MSPIARVCDIIAHFMELPNGRVMLWNQRQELPKDHGLFIVVRTLSKKPFGVSAKRLPTSTGLEEEISVNIFETLSIDVMSRGTDARDRAHEVLQAVNSVYAKQWMANESFGLARLSSGFADLSNEDGASIPYRFNITLNLQYSVRNQKSIPYYDSYENVDVKTNR